jgi:hypothetical protein
MQCVFCLKEVESIPDAVELGWYPEFWVGEVNFQGPVCNECLQEHLFTDESGEYLLKPAHRLPPLAVRMGSVEVRKEIRMTNLVVKPKFPLGQVLATPAALKALEQSGQSPEFFVEKHIQGDWGMVSEEDKRLNDEALVDGSRLLSAYKTLMGERLWIITEATDDQGRRASSTLLLPNEY